MNSTEAPQLTVVQPGGGADGNLGTIGVVFKLWAATPAARWRSSSTRSPSARW